jgi:hypothetical protein
LIPYPFETDWLPLSYSGNPGVNDEPDRGANWNARASLLDGLWSEQMSVSHTVWLNQAYILYH